MAAARVLFVNHASRLGGAELVLLDVVQAFRGARAFLFEDGPLRGALAGLGVTSVMPAAGGFASIKRNRSLWRALPHLGGIAGMLAQLVRTVRGSDVVYANSQKAFALAAPACAAARRPLIWHVHDILSRGYFGGGQIRLVVGLANRFARGVIVPSAAAADAFTAAGGKRSLVRVIPNGVNDVRGEVEREGHGLDLPFVFGVFSRLTPWKGQEVALRALPAVPGVGCVIAGGARFGEDEYARSLVRLAGELGVAERVRFLGQRDDVAALMRSVHAVVHPSTEPEPFGRTLVEAMLARRTVIAAEAGAVPEILDGGRVGLMFPPGDHAALAACLRRVQAGDAAGLIDPAEQRARQFYNAGRMRDAIKEMVAEVAGGRAVSAAAAAAPVTGMAVFWLRRAVPIGALLLVTLGLGFAGQGAARAVFVLGSAVVAWDLLRFGASAHFSGSLLLFCVAPFLRRVVDVSAGYDPSAIMISGPLLGLLVVLPRVVGRLSDGRRLEQALWPFITAAACLLYAMVLTMVQGQVTQAASGALTWGAPLVYGFWLYGEAGRDTGLVRSAARMSMVLAPVLGLYGFLQYVDPPAWDRFWMVYTSIASIGQAEPYKVRVFSMMNAPAGYATFTAVALLLFGFGRGRLTLLLAAGPSVLGLMLSMYRTAWIALAIGLLFGLFHRRALRRAALLLVAVPVLAGAMVLFTPARDALSERMGTFGSATSDASGQERLAGYAELLDTDGGTLWGNGFGSTDVLQAGGVAQDGQLVAAWSLMGLVVGIVSVAALLWVAILGIRGAWRSDTLEGVAVAGIIAGMMVQLPLAVIAASEIGFLFWSFAAIGAALPAAARSARPSSG